MVTSVTVRWPGSTGTGQPASRTLTSESAKLPSIGAREPESPAGFCGPANSPSDKCASRDREVGSQAPRCVTKSRFQDEIKSRQMPPA